jgi:hypothetical protein
MSDHVTFVAVSWPKDLTLGILEIDQSRQVDMDTLGGSKEC